MKLSIAEQMQVLQSCEDVATWSLNYLGLPPEWRDTNEKGNTERCQEAVNRVFTLTRADITASLATQDLQPEKLPRYATIPDSQDGWYFIAKAGEGQLYYQERGFSNVLVTFNDLAEARKLLLNEWIPIWLEHLRVPCRTKEGKIMLEM